MAAFARARGLALRPHAKTHKAPEIARPQLAAGATGLTVATVAEAEVVRRAGATDLFLAYPLWVDAARGCPAAGARRAGARSRVGVDSVEGAAALAAQLPGARVLVEVDSGQHRSGVPARRTPGSWPTAAAADRPRRARRVHLPRATATPPGQPPASPAQEADGTADGGGVAGRAGPRGLRGQRRAPPRARRDARRRGADRDAAGVYVFGDAQQWELGTATPDRIALTCVATVVSHAGGTSCWTPAARPSGPIGRPGRPGSGRLLGPSRRPDHPALRAPCGGRLGRDAAPRAGQPGARGAQPRVQRCQPPRRAGDHGRYVWPVAARGANT